MGCIIAFVCSLFQHNGLGYIHPFLCQSVLCCYAHNVVGEASSHCDASMYVCIHLANFTLHQLVHQLLLGQRGTVGILINWCEPTGYVYWICSSVASCMYLKKIQYLASCLRSTKKCTTTLVVSTGFYRIHCTGEKKIGYTRYNFFKLPWSCLLVWLVWFEQVS